MFRLNLLTPERAVEAQAELLEVTLPGARGELNILPGHTPLVTTLRPGTLFYRLANGKQANYSIAWGYCQVTSDGVTILAEFLKTKSEIDAHAVQSSLQELEQKLATESLSDEEYLDVTEKINWYRSQLEYATQTG